MGCATTKRVHSAPIRSRNVGGCTRNKTSVTFQAWWWWWWWWSLAAMLRPSGRRNTSLPESWTCAKLEEHTLRRIIDRGTRRQNCRPPLTINRFNCNDVNKSIITRTRRSLGFGCSHWYTCCERTTWASFSSGLSVRERETNGGGGGNNASFSFLSGFW